MSFHRSAAGQAGLVRCLHQLAPQSINEVVKTAERSREGRR